MQYSIHAPNQFIDAYLDRLLPDWSRPVLSVLVVLQPCPCDLIERTPATEEQKQQLRQNFLQFGSKVAAQLQHQGHLAEVFDPRTGFPLLSQPGQLRLDDVAIVRSCLGYPTVERYGCQVILHPVWGSSVYPSTLLSSAEPALVETLSTIIKQEMQFLSPEGLWEFASADRNATNLSQAGVG
ncbi:methylmalonic aciduria and homocystinuria type D protein [Kovacikia minuta CCNUW1]|uniref:methylmalonic aciduria and homocystinuria type D protein n=1 Tax=Kovacikia minuta TaxID=2931930 RepID=UPI001CC9AC13|nr:methylmalonic aciduria and homocystinuria type D protein [Kovacikia minuta]UBF24447.1 methylmalonic aciduria and homocystinuria type D protein [Kovacikia minuta CCNUW1]